MSGKLSILNDSSDSEVELRVNKEYANKYSIWRNKEELQKYKDLKKEDDDSESSSESEEELPEFDEEFFRALSLLKGKDPRLYDKNFELFSNNEIKKKKTIKEKPMFMKDYERNLVLERGGKFSDEDEPTLLKGQTYSKDQENLKESFKKVLDESEDDDDDADDLLQVRIKSKKEEEEEEADYLKWLKGEEKEVSEDIKKDMSYLRNYWNDPKLDEGEKFLRDYILNKKYLEKDDSELPTYEEVTSGKLSDDEKMIEEQEKFELKYNFRFEEPDEEFIKRYPRTIGDSLRKEDNRRKQKREEKIERKKREREQRKEELKRLKALKRKEIEEKFSKLKEISGQEEINFNESDMESDFDPDKHDQKMREMFDDDYYNVEEDKKPEFPFDEELDAENWNNWTGSNILSDEDKGHTKQAMKCLESHDLNDMETNIRDEFEKEMVEATQGKKKTRKKSLFAKVISEPKPIYDPDGKSFDEYLEEYYKLDYEDVIGDLPVRYKYRKVIPNDFGLSIDEILSADDKELNRWCSVKKTCQYRNDDEELYDVQAYKKKSQNIVVKKKVLSSVYAEKQPIFETENSVFNEDHETNIGNKIANSVNHEKNPNNSVVNCELNYEKSETKNQKEKLCHSLLSAEIDMQNCLVDSIQSVENIDSSKQNKSKKRKISHTDRTNSVLDNERDQNVREQVAAINAFPVLELISEKTSKKKHASLTEANLEKREKLNSKISKVIQEENDINRFSEIASPTNNKLNNNDVINLQHSTSVADSSFQETVAKKKKRKNKKSTEKAVLNKMCGQSGSQKFKNKQKEYAVNDKRLGLSDGRLSAYGINPKKFKNRIIHSKK